MYSLPYGGLIDSSPFSCELRLEGTRLTTCLRLDWAAVEVLGCCRVGLLFEITRAGYTLGANLSYEVYLLKNLVCEDLGC